MNEDTLYPHAVELAGWKDLIKIGRPQNGPSERKICRRNKAAMNVL